jgi:hypothetical protein
MTQETSKCIYCERDSQQVPLMKFEYQGSEYTICPGHLPILIHKPTNLADKLPGTENWPFSPGH